MIVYISNLVLILIYGLVYTYLQADNEIERGKAAALIREKVNLKAALCIIIGTQLFLIAALRYNVGTDDKVYQRMYEEIAQWGFMTHALEKGFGALNQLAAFLGHYQWVVVFSSLITIGCVAFAVYKYSKYPAISFFLYVSLSYYYATMCLIRQGIAVAIILLGLKYIREKCIWKYLIVVFIAVMFHNTALIMLPVGLLLNMRLDYKKMLLFFVPVLIVYIFLEDIFLFLARLIPRYGSVYATPAGIARYMTGYSWKSMIICVTVFIIMWMFKRRLLEKDEKNNIYFNLAFASVLLSLFTTKINVLDRLPYYANSFMILSLPLVIDCFDTAYIADIIKRLPKGMAEKLETKFLPKLSDRFLRRFTIVMLILFGALYNIYMFAEGYYDVLPYQTILFR